MACLKVHFSIGSAEMAECRLTWPENRIRQFLCPKVKGWLQWDCTHRTGRPISPRNLPRLSLGLKPARIRNWGRLPSRRLWRKWRSRHARNSRRESRAGYHGYLPGVKLKKAKLRFNGIESFMMGKGQAYGFRRIQWRVIRNRGRTCTFS